MRSIKFFFLLAFLFSQSCTNKDKFLLKRIDISPYWKGYFIGAEVFIPPNYKQPLQDEMGRSIFYISYEGKVNYPYNVNNETAIIADKDEIIYLKFLIHHPLSSREGAKEFYSKIKIYYDSYPDKGEITLDDNFSVNFFDETDIL